MILESTACRSSCPRRAIPTPRRRHVQELLGGRFGEMST